MTTTTAAHGATPLQRIIQMAESMGCQLRPQRDNPRLLRGLCPFHHSPRLHSVNTLTVNAETGRFQCQRCGAHGSPATFVAQCWGVTVAEANKMLERLDAGPVTADRPTPIALQEPERDAPPAFRIQNSYLLTQATEFYALELLQSLNALNYLARLGVSQECASRHRIGYAKGWGLAEYLRTRDVSDREMRESPLFHADGPHAPGERYNNIITIPDLDSAQGSRWMLALPPVGPNPGQPWAPQPPQALPLNGQRPYLFGLGAVPWNPPRVALTDDPRVILVMQQAGIPVCHTIGRQGSRENRPAPAGQASPARRPRLPGPEPQRRHRRRRRRFPTLAVRSPLPLPLDPRRPRTRHPRPHRHPAGVAMPATHQDQILSREEVKHLADVGVEECLSKLGVLVIHRRRLPDYYLRRECQRQGATHDSVKKWTPTRWVTNAGRVTIENRAVRRIALMTLQAIHQRISHHPARGDLRQRSLPTPEAGQRTAGPRRPPVAHLRSHARQPQDDSHHAGVRPWPSQLQRSLSLGPAGPH